MATKHYVWHLGDVPPVLGRHSLAKHTVLRRYLERYVAVLAARIAQERLKLTLVDGFSGGGAYLHPDTNERLPGSPIIMLEAMRAAEQSASEIRVRPFHLDVEYLFVEKSAPTIEFLRSEMDQRGLANGASDRVNILHGRFADHLDAILARIQNRSRSRRAIFVLDQFGYTDVRMADLRRIFSMLPNAEVVLTIAIDWLIDYWNETDQFDQTLQTMGIELPANTLATIKRQDPTGWRYVVQHLLHRELFQKSGAAYYTPFFIFSPEAHRAYWLMHLSGHSKARDVMTNLHWQTENHFEHYGKPGLGMLGYDPSHDWESQGYKDVLFKFDEMAKEETQRALNEELPQRLMNFRNGTSFRGLFDNVVNETPATMEMVARSVSHLSCEKDVTIFSADGKRRRNGVQVNDDDIITIERQKKLFLPTSAR